MSMRRIFYAAVVTLGCGSAAYAAPLYDSLYTGAGTGSANLAISVGNSGAVYANSFHTDASGTLQELEIALAKTGTANLGNIVVTLYSDNGLVGAGSDAPGSLVATIAGIPESLLSTSKGYFYFTDLGLTSLAPNSEYWIQVAKSGVGPSAAELYTTNVVPPVGLSGSTSELYFHGAVGAISHATPAEMQLCVSTVAGAGGETSCAVFVGATTTNIDGTAQLAAAPEPGSLGLLGSGLATLGFIMYRRRSHPMAG